MDVGELIDQLESDGPRLAAAAARAGWGAPVPSCPDWTVRDLVTHTGGVHRWAADIVTRACDTTETELGGAVGAGPSDDSALPGWFQEGHAALVAALRAAPDDLDCVTFLPAASPLTFWARRQAHETAIHRADAEGATSGVVTPFPAGFAQDGIGEMLHGFARRRRKALDRTGTIALRAEDGPSWLITLGGERAIAEQDDVTGDATVAGTSSELYLWLWNRPSAAVVSGAADVAELWRIVRVRWS
jgi:uncharacterized protein (TIGR03083 family)